MTKTVRVYPQSGVNLHRPPASDLHETAGIPGNWALDFMAPGGTVVVAPEEAVVTRKSGHNPVDGVLHGDVFGWNIYLTTPGGVIYFGTHIGVVRCRVGDKVTAGTVIGNVGHWPSDPGRSHLHLGVTHPMGKRAAVGRIVTVSNSPMVPPL